VVGNLTLKRRGRHCRTLSRRPSPWGVTAWVAVGSCKSWVYSGFDPLTVV